MGVAPVLSPPHLPLSPSAREQGRETLTTSGVTLGTKAPLIGLFMDGKTQMGPHMPTGPANMKNALVNNFEFWSDRDSELNERFNAWITAN